MARITVEDCVQIIPNRFELVAIASQRAKDLSAGARMHVNRDNDKNAVVALREIAESKLNIEQLREELVTNNQKLLQKDILETETDSPDLLAGIKEEMDSLVVREERDIDTDEGDDSYLSEENLDVDD
ncbi:MAG: DNA-directed RNA polymerase subunit omega [Alphaproteobacteria bacterium]|nr:DNA-directed RNA polymerase subunit omega [Alphaproteobacteria bacterium]